MPFGPGFALNFIQRICFLSSRFTWKACVINFILLGKLASGNVVHNGFRKNFSLKVFVWGYFHILFYITSCTCLFIKFSLLLWPQNLSPWAMLLQRCALDKICEIYTFDRCPHGCTGQKSFLACGDAKKENWRTTEREVERSALSESGTSCSFFKI